MAGLAGWEWLARPGRRPGGPWRALPPGSAAGGEREEGSGWTLASSLPLRKLSSVNSFISRPTSSWQWRKEELAAGRNVWRASVARAILQRGRQESGIARWAATPPWHPALPIPRATASGLPHSRKASISLTKRTFSRQLATVLGVSNTHGAHLPGACTLVSRPSVPVMQLFGCLYKARLVCFLKDFLGITHQTRAIQQALVLMDLGAEPG